MHNDHLHELENVTVRMLDAEPLRWRQRFLHILQETRIAMFNLNRVEILSSFYICITLVGEIGLERQDDRAEAVANQLGKPWTAAN